MRVFMKKRDDLSASGLRDFPAGSLLLNNPQLNKGTAFSEVERAALGLRGLLPPRVFTLKEQVARALTNIRGKSTDLDRYVYLSTLQTRNEVLFYRVVLDHLEELMPIIYTPTVGQACLEYGTILGAPRGLFLSIKDKGHVESVLRNWPHREARLIVVTDGERILGLGDLGAMGMGIPVGKLALYTACAGLHPYYTLPITLDVGTNNPHVGEDPFYVGLRQKRVRGAEYDAFIDEFVKAVQVVFPRALIQFEDFGNSTAFGILEKYRNHALCFNDDIQGTASVALAGLLGALRLTGKRLTEQKLLFFGAGEAGTGIGELFVAAAREEGLSEAEARARCWFVDSKGLVVKSRTDLQSHKKPFAHPHAQVGDLGAAVEAIGPTALIGVAGAGPAFTRPIVEAMARLNQRPVIFALSNPTSKAECTAENAYAWTGGRAVFASGSPFAPVTLDGKTYVPGQGNNVYIFPGVGLGALAFGARHVTDSMFLAAARVVAGLVEESDLAQGRVYPSLTRIREVSTKIAVAVGEIVYKEGLTELPRPADLSAYVSERMFVPDYEPFV
jgi:malate dehydrogenase (oxaloacetate-decarboxylating)(NADP+)